jgi:hypothetical protein
MIKECAGRWCVQSPPGAIFCGKKATLIEIRQALSNGAACELEGYLRLSVVSCPIALYPASSLSEKSVSIGSKRAID